ncbi:MAG: DNA mismatch repair endonuclease MutL [Tissierellia bacterium]|nr:DNA mismatch repair endonuclease MutL [Tissierellia bacterium]
MSKIVPLNSATISKIAAGEIIERPASVVKEMLENAIDAGSKNITVEIRGKTDEYIRISDDGEGMDAEDIELAFERHSTSKIKSIEDLDNLSTLGFRGEALPSIAHISSVEVISRREGDDFGTRLLIEYGNVIRKESIGAPIGTTFIVRNIFKNLPVRKKFLKKDQIEYQHIAEVVEKISLGTLNCSVTLVRNHKTQFQSFPSEDPRNHIYSILGKDVSINLIPIKFQSSSYKIQGYLSNNQLYRSSRSLEYLYVNGRYVKNLEISRALESMYRSKIPLNKFPAFILYIETDPMLIDVNIHPKKHEVKLSNQNRLIPILKQLYEEAFPDVIQSYHWEAPKEKEEEPSIFQLYPLESEEKPKVDLFHEVNIETSEIAKETIGIYDMEDLKVSLKSKELLESKVEVDTTTEEEIHHEEFTVKSKKEKWKNQLKSSIYIGSLFKTYLLFEDRKNDNFLLLDQHAAHERILYEKYLSEFKEEKVTRQILMSPEILRCTPKQFALIEEYFEDLNHLGFTLEIFGESEILLREVPYFFGKPGATSFLMDILDHINHVETNYDLNVYDIMRKACRSAIKAGDVLEEMEVDTLIQTLIQCEDPYTCPHGRPVLLELHLREIEKMFLRVGL